MRWIVLLLILLIGQSYLAAQECGYGLPCGPIPFDLPAYPILESPTPINSNVDAFPLTPTVAPDTPTPVPTFTSTPIPTGTPVIDVTQASDSIATLQAMQTATQAPVDAGDGTTLDIDDIGGAGGTDTSLLFGYVKGLTGQQMFGPFTPLINVAVFGFGAYVLLYILRYGIMVGATIIGLVRKAIRTVLDFIPFLG